MNENEPSKKTGQKIVLRGGEFKELSEIVQWKPSSMKMPDDEKPVDPESTTFNCVNKPTS